MTQVSTVRKKKSGAMVVASSRMQAIWFLAFQFVSARFSDASDLKIADNISTCPLLSSLALWQSNV